MNLIERFRRPPASRARAIATSTPGITPWRFDAFQSYVEGGLKSNGIVWACVAARSWVFADVQLRWQSNSDGSLFDSPQLQMFRRPMPGETQRTMLKRWEQDISLAGNAYRFRDNERFFRGRPDWVDCLIDPEDGDPTGGRLVGYVYWRGGRLKGDPVLFEIENTAHGFDTPDPTAAYKGISWLTPIITDIQSDIQMTQHKSKFFENAATPNLLVTLEKRIESKEARDRFRNELDRKVGGMVNAYSTLILDDGADAKVIGSSMEQLSFAATQAAGENRVCTAARVPPIVVGIKEGLEAATYSNYGQAMRAFADHAISPKWGETAEQLEQVVSPPRNSRLWYDASRVAALQQDKSDEAEINAKNAQTIRTYIDGGFTPESAAAAVAAGDVSLLTHSGLVSVQLQPPGTGNITENDND